MQRFASVVWGIILLASLTTTTCVAEAGGCVELHYDPVPVRLTGKVSMRIFAGPPNYESIPQGDRPESVWILGLSNSVCVSPLATDKENETATNVRELQLVFVEGSAYKQVRRFYSKRVVVTGKLFSAQSAHHHKKVLVEVVGIRSAPRHSNSALGPDSN